MLKNIFACLVHENTDCIIDLVKNLNFFDPQSIVLLYNGGHDLDLLNGYFPQEELQVIIHPNAKPQKYGYIHGFAMDCMRFAMENLEFDTMTIVDSDQLLIRKGYTEYLNSTIARSVNKAGLYSYDKRRVGPENEENYVALQAFQEYDLWKPFIRKFENGEEAFVHWTFWPSTIFAHHACRDLVVFLDKDEELQEIISRSSIWAIEEVLFPTLTRLIGYEIHSNPCKQELVKYKTQYGMEELNKALTDTKNFWIHPVERAMHNSIRKRIREMSLNYDTKASSNGQQVNPAVTFDFSFTDVLDRVDKIEGWLSRKEADLLMAATIKACIEMGTVHAMVEIGSFHGKSTVLIGNVLKNFHSRAKIYAIDPHNGVVGDEDKKIVALDPSLTAFTRNIEREKLNNNVELIQDFSFNVNWEKKISLLFIDGLHDYKNVARDFNHFIDYVKSGGYIAFHDYADYYPGVKTFVDEILYDCNFRKVAVADSLIVLQK